MTIEEARFSKLQKWSFGLGSFTQWFVMGAFNTWVFSFYFSAVKLPVNYIMTAFIIWTIWNAINDPFIGYLSDKTQTKWGRRKPFIVIGSIPIIIIEIIIWLPRQGNDTLNFIFLLLLLLSYDTFYTMISIPYDSLFPELYTTIEERAEVNTIRQIMATMGLICAFLLPGMFITTLSDPDGYLINGIVSSILIAITLFISIKFGVVEREEFKLDHAHEMGFFASLKYTLKNKGFILYTLMFFLYEYDLLLIGAMIPIYGAEVLGVSPFLTSIISGALFVMGILSVKIWEKLDLKYGSKIAFAISIIAYIIFTIPLLFVTSYIWALVTAVCMGFGFGGMLYFVYLLIADVIDEDEIKTGVRREGSFFGVTNFFMRLAMVASIVSIGTMFISTGWESWTPNPDYDVIKALQILIVVFPGIALGLTLICLYFYPFNKAKVEQIGKELHELHEKKKLRVKNIN